MFQTFSLFPPLVVMETVAETTLLQRTHEQLVHVVLKAGRRFDEFR